MNLQVSNLTSEPASRSSLVIILKNVISPLLLALGLPNMKTTYRKSRPENLLQVSNLTSEICCKVKWGHHAKKAL